MAKPKIINFSKTWEFENQYFNSFKRETDQDALKAIQGLQQCDKVKKITALKPTFQQYKEAFVKNCNKRITNKIIENTKKFGDDSYCMNFPLIGYSVALAVQFLTNNAKNIYFENEKLESFLRNTRIKQISGIKEYIKQNGNKLFDILNSNEMFNEEEGNIIYQIFNVHIPNQVYGYVFIFLYSPEKDSLYVGFVQQQNKQHKTLFALCLDNEDDLKSLNKDLADPILDLNDQKLYSNIVFAVNFLYYILCFPEMLINGLAVNIKNANESEQNKQFLHISPKIVEPTTHENKGNKEGAGSKCTHFRQGHFRFCGSDYYKQKKGQVVFVHASIINGNNVKTCLNKED